MSYREWLERYGEFWFQLGRDCAYGCKDIAGTLESYWNYYRSEPVLESDRWRFNAMADGLVSELESYNA